jgi:hypothetical protein
MYGAQPGDFDTSPLAVTTRITGIAMAQTATKQLQALKQTCAQARTARKRVQELEAQRNEIIARLRRAGVRTGEIAAACGLSPGRVTQIADL